MTGQVGTPGWTAPEVFKHNSYNHKVDVYSFGVVLAECLSVEKARPRVCGAKSTFSPKLATN